MRAGHLLLLRLSLVRFRFLSEFLVWPGFSPFNVVGSACAALEGERGGLERKEVGAIRAYNSAP